MDMQLNTEKLKQLREHRAWSQSHLADVAGVSLRTIQRVEKSGVASPETVKAICASYSIDVADLLEQQSIVSNTAFGGEIAIARPWLNPLAIKYSAIAFIVAFIIAFAVSY
ncbi:helix-turn-helix transcriptional regulator [uncultured Pseudoteredinibacter sp.]|uniref:helix-turn-helix transcriptional regulator n=1 Tax=uncultured Pseudoteredinibacter sp. TaxID=1641701 RepID=UPI0026322B2E|nr:helix-turn-helix transcriptional regulator [uncultured Pseudoteredinibacter sp.]